MKVAYISYYEVTVTYRWKPATSYSSKTAKQIVTVQAPNERVAVARAMIELYGPTDIYPLEIEVTSDGDGWYDYD